MEKGKEPDNIKGPTQSIARLLKSTEATSKRTPISQKLIGREKNKNIRISRNRQRPYNKL